MTQLLRFWSEDSGNRDVFVVVEVADDEPGVIAVSRLGDTVADATASFEGGINRIREAAAATLARLRDMPRRPDEVCLEFGLRFNAEAGAVIAKSGGEAHLNVRMTWRSQDSGSDDSSDSADSSERD